MSTVGMYDESIHDNSSARLDSVHETIGHLKDNLYALDYNSDYKSPIDAFIRQYDQTAVLGETMSERFNSKLNLKREAIHQLGFSPTDFYSVIFKSNQPAIDSAALTGGNYADGLVDEVRKFCNTLRVSYCSIFWLYLRKEHKLISLFNNLHIEFTKT
jgi:hypothetical protein